MQRLSLFILILLFAAQGLFSQTHLLKGEQHGYDFNWLYRQHYGSDISENIGWDNTVSIGYTHAGRVHFLAGFLSHSGSRIDVWTPTSHHFESHIKFALLKQGINKAPITLNGITGIRLGGSKVIYTENTFKIGIGIYKRIEKSETFSINPGIEVHYDRELNLQYGWGYWGVHASCDFLFGRFKVSPTLGLRGDTGYLVGAGLGFVLPTFNR